MKIVQRILNWVSLLFAVVLVVSAVTFLYILLVPLDVVTNWKLHVDPGTYPAGSRITLRASYEKLRDASGQAYYYLECETPRDSLVRYPISQTEGNRPKGSGTTDIFLQLPGELADLPATCRVAVAVDYTIYAFRKFPENNVSNEFTVSKP